MSTTDYVDLSAVVLAFENFQTMDMECLIVVYSPEISLVHRIENVWFYRKLWALISILHK